MVLAMLVEGAISLRSTAPRLALGHATNIQQRTSRHQVYLWSAAEEKRNALRVEGCRIDNVPGDSTTLQMRYT